MSRRRRDDENEPSFADLVDGARPLEDRDKRRRNAPRRASPRPPARPSSFDFPDPDDRGLGVASGIQTSQLRRLRDGRIRPDRTIDLHGLRAKPARRALIDEVAAAIQADERCVLVIHGKGLHSSREPVLRNTLPDWLADPRLESRVLAFAPAQPTDGGRGASYVLLRRSAAARR